MNRIQGIINFLTDVCGIDVLQDTSLYPNMQHLISYYHRQEDAKLPNKSFIFEVLVVKPIVNEDHLKEATKLRLYNDSRIMDPLLTASLTLTDVIKYANTMSRPEMSEVFPTGFVDGIYSYMPVRHGALTSAIKLYLYNHSDEFSNGKPNGVFKGTITPMFPPDDEASKHPEKLKELLLDQVISFNLPTALEIAYGGDWSGLSVDTVKDIKILASELAGTTIRSKGDKRDTTKYLGANYKKLSDMCASTSEAYLGYLRLLNEVDGDDDKLKEVLKEGIREKIPLKASSYVGSESQSVRSLAMSTLSGRITRDG